MAKYDYFACKKEDFEHSDDSLSVSSESSVKSLKPQIEPELCPTAKFVHSLVKKIAKSGFVWKTVSNSSISSRSSDFCSSDKKVYSKKMEKVSDRQKRKRDSSENEEELDEVPSKEVSKNHKRRKHNRDFSGSEEEHNLHHKKKKYQESSENNISKQKTLKKKNIHSVSSSDEDYHERTYSSKDEVKEKSSKHSLGKSINHNNSLSEIGENREEKNESIEHQANYEVYEEPSITQDDKEEIFQFSSLCSENFISKNNFWTLQCPTSMDCSELVGQRLSLSDNGSCKLKTDDCEFEAYSYQDHFRRSATLAVPSHSNLFNLYKVPISGNIILEQTRNIQLRRSKVGVQELPESVELPKDLRIRHPLFGLDYEKKCKTATRHKKSSNKKKHSWLPDESVVVNGTNKILEEEAHDEIRSKKHKKKKKSNYLSD